MVHISRKMTRVPRALRGISVAVALLVFSGCSMLQPAPEATPAPTPSPSPSPSPTPAPAIAVQEGEPVSGIVGNVLAHESGVYMFSFASARISVTVLADESVFADELGSRAERLSPGDRVEIVFDSPIIEGEYAQGEARSVKTLLYADCGDYVDPFLTAFLWAFSNHDELNAGAVAVVFPPSYGTVTTPQFAPALQSFCQQNGYSLKFNSESAGASETTFIDSSDWLVFHFTDVAQNGDNYVISIAKSRKYVGEAGATLTVALEDGVWNVRNVKNEFINLIDES